MRKAFVGSVLCTFRLSTEVIWTQASPDMGHSGEYGNAAKFVGEMSKSVMQLISIHF